MLVVAKKFVYIISSKLCHLVTLSFIGHDEDTSILDIGTKG